MVILSRILKKMRNVILWGIERLLWDIMGELQVKSRTVISIIISDDALPHPVSGQDIAEPCRAREGKVNSIEQRRTVYRDEQYQTQVTRNPRQRWVNR